MSKWAVRVTYASGYEAFLRHGSRAGAGHVVTFSTRKLAEINADFIRMGMDDGDTAVAVLYRKGDDAND